MSPVTVTQGLRPVEARPWQPMLTSFQLLLYSAWIALPRPFGANHHGRCSQNIAIGYYSITILNLISQSECSLEVYWGKAVWCWNDDLSKISKKNNIKTNTFYFCYTFRININTINSTYVYEKKCITVYTINDQLIQQYLDNDNIFIVYCIDIM